MFTAVSVAYGSALLWGAHGLRSRGMTGFAQLLTIVAIVGFGYGVFQDLDLGSIVFTAARELTALLDRFLEHLLDDYLGSASAGPHVLL